MQLLKKDEMMLIASNEKFLAKIIFKNLNGEQSNDSIILHRFQADIFFQLKEQNENEVGERKQQ